jgi:hypothetical protein
MNPDRSETALLAGFQKFVTAVKRNVKSDRVEWTLSSLRRRVHWNRGGADAGGAMAGEGSLTMGEKVNSSSILSEPIFSQEPPGTSVRAAQRLL